MALTDNLVAYWKLDEGSGTSAADATGSGNGLTLVGSPAWVTGAAANTGGGLSFSGSNYGTAAGASAGITNDFTIAAWLKWTANGHQRPIALGTDTGPVFWNNGALGFGIVHNGIIDWNGIFTFPSDTWAHFAITRAGNTATAYLNSVQKAQRTNFTVVYTFDNVAIGKDFYGSFADPYSGSMDEVGIWSRTLTSTEISQLYNSGSGLQYPFTGGGGGSIILPPYLFDTMAL